MSDNKQIAHTILAQLGGQKFIVMTGANTLTSSENGLSMRLPSNMTKKRATHMTIRLAANDLYEIETRRIQMGMKRGFTNVLLDSVTDVGCEQLQSEFTRLTGLDTRL